MSFLSFKVSQALKRGAVVSVESATGRQNKDFGVAGPEFKSRLWHLGAGCALNLAESVSSLAALLHPLHGAVVKTCKLSEQC